MGELSPKIVHKVIIQGSGATQQEQDVEVKVWEEKNKKSPRSDVRLSYHNWKLAACVESLKSMPMETVTEASGSSRSANGRGGAAGKKTE